MNMKAFRDIAPCSIVEVDRSFRCTYGLHRSDDARQYASPKRRSISTILHGAISQKAFIFILAAVRTSNLTMECTQDVSHTFRPGVLKL
jgi:hypothetical protein